MRHVPAVALGLAGHPGKGYLITLAAGNLDRREVKILPRHMGS